MHGRHFVVALAACSAVLLTPVRAVACSVCGLAGPGDNGWAYFTMTMVMSTLPLTFIGGVVFWVYRRMSDADSTPAETLEDATRRP